MHARDRGHVPVFAIPALAAEIVGQFGLEVISVSDDLPDLRNEINRSWISDEDSYFNSEKLLYLLSPFQQHFHSTFEKLLEACDGADVLISGPAQPLSRIVHEYLGIPFVSVQFSHFGGTGGSGLEEAGQMLVNPFRRRLGLPEVRHPFTSGANSPQLALYAMSPQLRPRPSTWPSHYHITGFWFTSEKVEIAPELKKFVENGSPPIAVTLGSMVGMEGVDLRELVTTACRLIDARAVVQGAGPYKDLSDRVFCTGYVPHEWLFAHTSCVVLHGGAGTAASVFRAGVPGVFIPHGTMYDQAYWAQIACEMGCATEPIFIRDLSAGKLATAIQRTVETESIRSRAAEIGGKIRGENGVAKAWRLVEEFIYRHGLYG
jgi:UDP:flavonoid glycosyltransferase YjiC (YdhE family)